MNRPLYIYNSPCYYCICTVCSEINCPHSDKCCDCLKLRKEKMPRLDCDKFTAKRVKRYHFRRGKAQIYYAVYLNGQLIYSHLTLSEAQKIANTRKSFKVVREGFDFPYSDR